MAKKLTLRVATARAIDHTTNNLVAKLDGLSAKCDAWEHGIYQTATDALYELLAECLDIYQQDFIKATDDVKAALRLELVNRLQSAGIRVFKTTLTMHLLVRYVFKSDRRRAHVYGYVLRAAVADGIAGWMLPDYIRSAGGVEEIRRKQVVKEETLKAREQLAAAVAWVIAEIEQNSVSPLGVIDAPTGEDFKDFCVVLGKPRGDGTIALVSVLSDVSESMLKQFTEKVAKVRVSQVALKAQVNKEAGSMLEPAVTQSLAEDMELLAA